MPSYKVVIPSAGIGSRIGPYTKTKNKALVQVGLLPTIVQIINGFPNDIEIVVILGYRGDHVKQACQALLPDRKISFVYVDKFEGEGSGLGFTLLAAQSELQCPFVFCPNDTLVEHKNQVVDPNIVGNWVGYYRYKDGDSVPIQEYRTLQTRDDFLVQINAKGMDSKNVYTGLCGVRDYETFWKVMAHQSAIEIGESFAIRQMDGVRAIEFKEWYDTGNLESIKEVKTKYASKSIHILEKEDEAIWFNDTQVVKFHIDEKFISDRVKRLDYLDRSLFPEITSFTKNTYTYDKLAGTTLAKVISTANVIALLNEMQSKLWSIGPTSPINNSIKHLMNFYKIKTFERINHYFERFEKFDQSLCINDIECGYLLERLSKLDWDTKISKAILGRFHGDFHSENIIVNGSLIKLIDWRQNFGSLGYEFGDVYYDLAKFLHGLIVSHEKVSQERFSISYIKSDIVNINIEQSFLNNEAMKVFQEWCIENKYDYEHVEFVTGLIFLNIAGLHEHPYSDFLFFLGNYILAKQEQRLGT